MMDVTALSSLLTVLLVVTEPQILTDRIMRVIDQAIQKVVDSIFLFLNTSQHHKIP